MSQQKPLILDPIKAAKEERKIHQTFTFSHLPQLHHCIMDGSYHFDFIAQFRYENHKALLDGRLSGTLMLVCQRTLEPYEYIFDAPLYLGFVTDDRFFKNFPENYEPYVYHDNQINLVELIEEEILLLIPMIPKKPLSDCQDQQNTSYCGVFETSDIEKPDKPNPFAALKALKPTKKN